MLYLHTEGKKEINIIVPELLKNSVQQNFSVTSVWIPKKNNNKKQTNKDSLGFTVHERESPLCNK